MRPVLFACCARKAQREKKAGGLTQRSTHIFPVTKFSSFLFRQTPAPPLRPGARPRGRENFETMDIFSHSCHQLARIETMGDAWPCAWRKGSTAIGFDVSMPWNISKKLRGSSKLGVDSSPFQADSSGLHSALYPKHGKQEVWTNRRRSLLRTADTYTYY